MAWAGRGFRSPLRDYLLADEVAPERFGRAYGIERTADMLGAVAGPLLAVALVTAAVPLRSIVALSVVPAAVSVVAIIAMTRDRRDVPVPPVAAPRGAGPRRLPPVFWAFLVGVFLFGLGDFSRTFLVLLGTRAFGGRGDAVVPSAVLVYAIHNAVSALAAYPIGRLGDRRPRMVVLAAGYALGVATNLLLAGGSDSAGVLIAATVLSGVYIAAEETLEKAIAAELLPRGVRSLGFGILAAANALGDMVSSLYVGALLEAGRPSLAFGIAAGVGAVGFAWMALFARARVRVGV
jgi:MFS family permease